MIAYLGYRAIERLSRWIPLQAGYLLAQAASWACWLSCPAIRRQVCRNLSRLSGAAAKSHALASRRVFRNFGYYLFETFAMYRLKQPIVATEGLEHLQQAFQENHGVIVLTAHLGNWELGAKILQGMGFPASAVALPHPDSRLNMLFDAQRKRYGASVIPLDRQAAQACLEALSKGRLLGLVADRDFMGDGMPMAVGNATLVVPRGPAVLSLRSQAPIVPVFLIREGWWRFRLLCQPVLRASKELPARQSIEALVRAYAKNLEAMLKRYSDQWLMFEAAFQT